MQKYEDDPNELIVNTNMEGTRYQQEAARDVNFLMQGEVDRLQKGYMQ